MYTVCVASGNDKGAVSVRTIATGLSKKEAYKLALENRKKALIVKHDHTYTVFA